MTGFDYWVTVTFTNQRSRTIGANDLEAAMKIAHRFWQMRSCTSAVVSTRY